MAARTTVLAGGIAALDRGTPADRVAAFIDRIRACPLDQSGALLPLLSERHPVYCDRSAGESVRIRGYAMASLELTGLPNRGLPYVLEALESDFHPYMVAAAARALRGMDNPHPGIAPYLIKAVYNIWGADNPVSFASYHVNWPQKEFSTGLTEVFGTLAGFGGIARKVLPDLNHLSQCFADQFGDHARASLQDAIHAIGKDDREAPASCCGLPLLLEGGGENRNHGQSGRVPLDLVIQDHEGLRLEWGDFFHRKPTVLAFFYTRCGNPRKCTQTIFNLVSIHDELERAGLAGKARVAAITYDPQFDTPEALSSYGAARRFRFDEDCRMFRVPEGFDRVVQAFGLGVNFTGSRVNSHRIELFLLDSGGQVVRSFLRIQSEPPQLVEAVRLLLSSGHADENRRKVRLPPRISAKGKVYNRFQAASSLVFGFLMAFFPKCPMCWVSYMSFLGLAGARSVPYSPWWLAAIVGLLLANLYFLRRRAAERNGNSPFLLSLIGSILLFLSVPQFGLPRWMVVPGFGLLLAGSLLQALSYSKFNRVRLFVSELRYRFFWQRH